MFLFCYNMYLFSFPYLLHTSFFLFRVGNYVPVYILRVRTYTVCKRLPAMFRARTCQPP